MKLCKTTDFLGNKKLSSYTLSKNKERTQCLAQRVTDTLDKE